MMGESSVLHPASPQAREILDLLRVVLITSSVIFAVVAGLVATSVVRFRARAGDRVPEQKTGSTRLEVTWTVIPLLILVMLFGLSVRVMHAVQPPAGDREPDLDVTAHQWWWEGHYPATGVTTANEFHFPVGRDLLLTFRSDDVVHDWWVPELGRKVDIFPNHPTHLWMKIEKPGTYLGTCDEFCGAEHAWMRIRVIAQSPEDYDAWTRAQLRAPAPPDSPDADEGRALFAARTCANCHAIQGLSSGTIGPDLTHVASRATLAAGALDNTREDMSRWVRDAQAIKPGCNMPAMDLSREQSRQVATYLEGLR